MPSVLLDENQAGLAPHRASMVWVWVVMIVGSVAVAIALWFTVGPWSVTDSVGHTLNCGSPFMGRYRVGVGQVDPAATGAVACHLQAANRLHIAEVTWIAGFVFVLLGIALLFLARRQSELHPTAA